MFNFRWNLIFIPHPDLTIFWKNESGSSLISKTRSGSWSVTLGESVLDTGHLCLPMSVDYGLDNMAKVYYDELCVMEAAKKIIFSSGPATKRGGEGRGMGLVTKLEKIKIPPKMWPISLRSSEKQILLKISYSVFKSQCKRSGLSDPDLDPTIGNCHECRYRKI